jgi:NAD(P)-dependent dehydrogenase (short-subunit alcohol dehydrogenase family)
VPPSQQRTALVTGAARGIGAAIAAEFVARGVNVVAPTRQELELADPAAIEHFLTTQKTSGVSIDILVNNAGINFINPLEDVSQETWHKTFQVNVHAPFRLAQALAPAMKERRWGRIVNISSMFSVVSRQHRAVYSATKSALNGLTRTLAIELGPGNVLVNSVGPGYVETALTRQNNSAEELDRIAGTIPLRRLAQPEEIAKFVAFLCSEDNTYITGQLLLADGGFTIL